MAIACRIRLSIPAGASLARKPISTLIDRLIRLLHHLSSNLETPLKPGPQPRPRPEQQRPYRRFALAQHRRHLCRAQLFARRKQQHMTLGFRQLFHLRQHCLHALRLVDRPVSRHIAADQAFDEQGIHLVGPDTPTTIQRQVPRNPDQPDPHIPHLIKLAAMLQHSHEHVLDYILSLGPAPQHGMCHPKQLCGIGLDEGGEDRPPVRAVSVRAPPTRAPSTGDKTRPSIAVILPF